MALTKEDLMNHRQLTGLTEELAAALVSIVSTEEQKQINTAIGSIYGNLDDDFQPLFPDAERGSQKSYKFWAAQVANLKRDKEALDASLEELTSELTTANEKIKKGITDEDATTKIAELENKIVALRDEYEGKLTNVAKTYEDKRKEEMSNSVKREYDIIENRMKADFKKDLPESILNGHLKSLKDSFFNEVEAVFDEDLGRFVFKKDGQTLRNKETQAELTLEDIQKASYTDILENPLPGGGGGGKPPGKPGGGQPSGFDVSQFESKEKAVEGLETYVTNDLKLPPGSDEYQAKLDEIYASDIASM